MKAYVSLFGAAIAVIVGGAFFMYQIESPHPDSDIKTLFDAFWWASSTVTTVGYGDTIPVTELGKAFGIIYMFFGIAIAGVFLSLVGTRYYKKKFFPKEDNDYYVKKLIEKIDNLEKQHKADFKKIEEKLKKLEDK